MKYIPDVTSGGVGNGAKFLAVRLARTLLLTLLLVVHGKQAVKETPLFFCLEESPMSARRHDLSLHNTAVERLVSV